MDDGREHDDLDELGHVVFIGLVLVDDGAEADGDGDQHDAVDEPIQQTSRVLCFTHLSPCTARYNLTTVHGAWVKCANQFFLTETV